MQLSIMKTTHSGTYFSLVHLAASMFARELLSRLEDEAYVGVLSTNAANNPRNYSECASNDALDGCSTIALIHQAMERQGIDFLNENSGSIKTFSDFVWEAWRAQPVTMIK